MDKKILIQILLSLVIFMIISSIFYFYIFDKSTITQEVINQKVEASINTKSSNLIDNIEYISKDNKGNEYKITAKEGEMNLNDSEVIFMSGVMATIIMKNSDPIYIKSNFATYNNENYDTTFKENVLITYLSHKINGENFNLSFQNNMATMTEKVIYTNFNTSLDADRLEIDLITKNSKIFMNNKNEKVKILIKE